MDHVAKLAKLNLTKAESDKFVPQLENIINFIGKLKEVDTDGIIPTSQTTGLINVVREDIVKNDQTIQIDSPYKVPAILEGRTNK